MRKSWVQIEDKLCSRSGQTGYLSTSINNGIKEAVDKAAFMRRSVPALYSAKTGLFNPFGQLFYSVSTGPTTTTINIKYI
jgi:hypothetical protein